MQSNFKITQSQKDQLKPFIQNIDEYESKRTLIDLLHELNLVISGELDENYEDTENSLKLQKIYDELLKQND
mgnify:CR=1 FL=1